MKTIPTTGSGIYYLCQLFFAIWLMLTGFGDPQLWFHIFGVAAFALLIVRLARGDD